MAPVAHGETQMGILLGLPLDAVLIGAAEAGVRLMSALRLCANRGSELQLWHLPLEPARQGGRRNRKLRPKELVASCLNMASAEMCVVLLGNSRCCVSKLLSYHLQGRPAWPTARGSV